MTVPVLTIDGPSGAGKGTVSRAVAAKLGWHYLDSGALYRALALAAQKQAINLQDQTSLAEVAQTMSLEFICASQVSVMLDGEEITRQLGLESTGNAASIVAALPAVRQALLQKQKDFKRLPGLVADGRDMGTVVFPEARTKVFLTASAIKRAERRYKQLKEKGIDANLTLLAKEIEDRDRRDSERKIAPLAMAADAIFIDSSEMTQDAVIQEVLSLIR